MTTKEKEVMLTFIKEQQRYNESLTAFCQLLCNISTEEDTHDPDNPH